MTTFMTIMEIYKDDEIKYLTMEFMGGSKSLPKQEDMEDRQYIVDQVQKIVDYEVLDLVGIVQNGKTIWKDGI